MKKIERIRANHSNPGKHRWSDWYQIVQFGARLLETDLLTQQAALIEQAAQTMLGCSAQVWIAESESTSIKEIPGFAQEAMELDDPILVDTLTGESNQPLEAQTNLPHNQACSRILASIRLHENNLGAVQLEREEPFTKYEVLLVRGLIDQSALAIQASRQIATEQRQLELLRLVRSIASQISELRNLDDLYNIATDLIQNTFGYYYAAIFITKPGANELLFKAYSASEKSLASTSAIFPVNLGEGIIGSAAQSGQMILVNDVTQNHLYRPVDSLVSTMAEMAIPLKFKGEVLGVLDVQSNQKNAFSQSDLLVLQALADNIASAIENARLYSGITQRVNQLASVAEVSQAISSILDEDELLEDVTRLIYSRLGYEFVQLFFLHDGQRKIFFKAGIFKNQQVQLKNLVYDLDSSLGIIPWVARNAKVYMTGDVTVDEFFIAPPNIPIQSKSEIAIPLIFGENVLGILDIQSEDANAFDEDDRSVLETLADNIAVAMHNAFLYRSELWRRRVAEGMRETAGLLSTSRDINPFLLHSLQELDRILPIDIGAIWLFDEEKSLKSDHGLRLRTVYLSDSLQFISPDHMAADEIIAFYNQAGVPSIWLLDALESDQPTIRQASSPYEPLGAILDFPSNYSAIAAPLIVSGQAIGLLTLCHHTAGRYGAEASNMADTYASYIAVAIQNNRLYKTARKQAWVSTVLLQVAGATESLSNLTDLLQTMARLIPTLVGVRSCNIFLYDEAQGIFSPAVCYGLTQPQEVEFWALTPAIGDSPELDQAFFTKNVVFIEEISSGSNSIFSTLFDAENHTAAIFPLVTHGAVVGVILVDRFFSTQVEGFGDRVELEDQIMLLQGISHQTAIAVENIMLLQAQQEETYISVALLQVAQSVSTLNNLEDILASITRLMPILIGVRRCLIFLWDADEKKFTLSQFFGLTRSELSLFDSQFAEGKFPILDLCRTFNQPLLYEVHPDEDSPVLWKTFDETEVAILKADIGGGFEDSNQDGLFQARLLWNSPSRLLTAFPLSVKDAFLGVIFTEENQAPALSRVKTREKRHEITLGVAQQAALAIHNNKLRHEVLAREKLEREFQLAREIQKTFLPDELPQPPGWQIAAMWQPARQVSGDFYDAFELPDRQVGIVIADVADKGMPAALFMTLIRTLVRSAIRENASPANVLARVNDLLLPDAKRGMFVTLVYCVFDPIDGRLTYANAGHNPPLVVRQGEGMIEKLMPTGMALGIMALPSITEVELDIKPGDLLILYTDGITEAFSPEGQMFGDDRFQDLVNQSRSNDPTQLTELIITHLSDFINPLPFSDDLTMIAVKRMQVGETD
jgi:serine phosphatase RsbU (regulator of sigma subunit)/transcriptional regulator with GAF, ATPase, and Fis domain